VNNNNGVQSILVPCDVASNVLNGGSFNSGSQTFVNNNGRRKRATFINNNNNGVVQSGVPGFMVTECMCRLVPIGQENQPRTNTFINNNGR
jgi:hypothetical protein